MTKNSNSNWATIGQVLCNTFEHRIIVVVSKRFIRIIRITRNSTVLTAYLAVISLEMVSVRM